MKGVKPEVNIDIIDCYSWEFQSIIMYSSPLTMYRISGEGGGWREREKKETIFKSHYLILV